MHGDVGLTQIAILASMLYAPAYSAYRFIMTLQRKPMATGDVLKSLDGFALFILVAIFLPGLVSGAALLSNFVVKFVLGMLAGLISIFLELHDQDDVTTRGFNA